MSQPCTADDAAAGRTDGGKTRSLLPGRFDFPELDLAPPPAAEAPIAEAEPSIPRSEHAARLAEACAEAADRARVDAETAMGASIQSRLALALEQIAAALAALQAPLAAQVASRAGASRELALALAGALVPRALARAPLADIEAMLASLVARLEPAPTLRLALPPALLEPARDQLAELIVASGYSGQIEILPDPRLGPGDARLTWQDGVASRDLAALERELRLLVDAWLPPLAPAPAPETLAAAPADAEGRSA